jgi:hypothetical protein
MKNKRQSGAYRRGIPLDDEGKPLYGEDFDAPLVRGMRQSVHDNIAESQEQKPKSEKRRKWRFLDLFR